MAKRRIVVCNDGTWNSPDDEDRGKRRPTNITKISRAILPVSSQGVSQIAYYDEGVGTGFAEKLIGGATGYGLSKNVIQAYRFIVNNYRAGDEIFLFGFSRGAFTSRSLLGFLAKVGVVTKDDAFYTPELYDLYRKDATPQQVDAFYQSKDLKRIPPVVKMIGVFDTVGALGLPFGKINKWLEKTRVAEISFHDVGLHDFVEQAYHALAIDELRKPFAPDLWSSKPAGTQTMEQRWFAGVHSNIGGGYKPDGLANLALHYIIAKAKACGLEIDDDFLAHYQPRFDSELRESMSFKYRLIGQHLRPISLGDASNQVIDPSVQQRRDGGFDYAPENV